MHVVPIHFMIPKIVHQTWYRKDRIPEWLKEIQGQNQRMNPEVEFHVWGDEDIHTFLLEYRSQLPPYLLEAYYRINPRYGACRADIFRYVLIYLKGGIYMDMKIRCKVPFREWIDFDRDKAIVSYWPSHIAYEKATLGNEHGELQNWFLVFEEKNIYLRTLLETLSTRLRNETKLDYFGKAPILHLTGPVMYTRILEPWIQDSLSTPSVQRVRVVQSWIYLEYGNFFHQHQLGKEHYIWFTEPLLLKSHQTIPHEVIHMPPPSFLREERVPPGFYILSLRPMSLRCRVLYPLFYLCHGVDLIVGYDPESSLLVFGCFHTCISPWDHWLESFLKHRCMQVQETIHWLASQSLLLKQVSLQSGTEGGYLQVQFHHQSFVEIERLSSTEK